MLDWLKARTKGYKNVEVADFTDSWVDGLAFCAVLHSYCPELIDYGELQPEAKLQNLDLAFTVAEKLGIPKLMQPVDLLAESGPDKFSVITYLAQFVDHFRNKEPRPSTPCPPSPSFVQQFTEHEESKRQEEEHKKRIKAEITKVTGTDLAQAGVVADRIAEFEAKSTQKRSYQKGDPFIFETVPTGLVAEKIATFMKHQEQRRLSVEFIMVTSTTQETIASNIPKDGLSNIYYIMRDNLEANNYEPGTPVR